MPNQNQENDNLLWQKHLDAIDSGQSAENFFINQIKTNNQKLDFDPTYDFFVSPFTNEEFSARDEGQLTVDVFHTPENIVVKSTLAGVSPEDIEIILEGDVLTIKGTRHNEDLQEASEYLYQECYWGRFSRSIILPTEVDRERLIATFKNGVLKIVLPKKHKDDSVKINVLDLDQ